MLAVFVAVDKDIAGTVMILIRAAVVGALDLFGVVIECMMHLVHQFAAEMEVGFDEQIFNLLQRYHQHIVFNF